jgi:type IV secretion system protein VirB5
MREMKWWRGIIGLGFLGISLLNLIFFIVALSMQKTVPVLVNVMPSGEASYLGEVRQTNTLQVPEEAILIQVKKFITNLRSISIDYEVVFNNIDDCYAMITRSYEPVLTRFLRSSSPFDLVGKTRRSVDIESALRITGSSYQIDWIETSTELSGSPQHRKMRALVTVKLLPPDPSFIKRNPLGIFIENCEWTEL